jgi:hypothetical protein
VVVTKGPAVSIFRVKDFYPEDGSDMFLWNVNTYLPTYLPDYTVI